MAGEDLGIASIENGGPMTVIYIAGLGHSGSTLLQQLLAGHPDIVGLGEIGQQVEKLLLEPASAAGQEPCSCGAAMGECLFWGELIANNCDDRRQAYEAIFARFREMYPGKVAVDSSKGFRHLARYRESVQLDDVRVVLIVRDYRSWALSRCKTNQRKQRPDPGYVLACYRWMFANLRLILRLSSLSRFSSRQDRIYVAFEDLVFDTQVSLRRICESLGIPHCESMLEREAVAHNVLGNRMRTDFQKHRRIRYNHGWMMNPRIALLAPLVFPVHVYQVLQRWWLQRGTIGIRRSW